MMLDAVQLLQNELRYQFSRVLPMLYQFAKDVLLMIKFTARFFFHIYDSKFRGNDISVPWRFPNRLFCEANLQVPITFSAVKCFA